MSYKDALKRCSIQELLTLHNQYCSCEHCGFDTEFTNAFMLETKNNVSLEDIEEEIIDRTKSRQPLYFWEVGTKIKNED